MMALGGRERALGGHDPSESPPALRDVTGQRTKIVVTESTSDWESALSQRPLLPRALAPPPRASSESPTAPIGRCFPPVIWPNSRPISSVAPRHLACAFLMYATGAAALSIAFRRSVGRVVKHAKIVSL